MKEEEINLIILSPKNVKLFSIIALLNYINTNMPDKIYC